jgi:uncharacterized protein
MDKKVELQVINITNSQAQVGAFAMLLGEVDGERQLPIQHCRLRILTATFS